MAKQSFLSSPKGKKMVGYAYGFGAAIVIVGALFKILHLPGASVVLTLGMGTEAILFALSAFEDPHKEYHWETVFPQLEGGEGGAILGGAAPAASKAGNSIDDIAKAGKLSLTKFINNICEGSKNVYCGNTNNEINIPKTSTQFVEIKNCKAF